MSILFLLSIIEDRRERMEIKNVPSVRIAGTEGTLKG